LLVEYMNKQFDIQVCEPSTINQTAEPVQYIDYEIHAH